MYTNLDIYYRTHYSVIVYTCYLGDVMSNDKAVETIGIREFRNKLKETLERVEVSGERILLGKHGKSVAALVPVEDVDLAVQMEQKLAETALLNDENLPLSAPSETSLDELMADYTPNEYDSSRYGVEEPHSLGNELNELSCAIDSRQMREVESVLLADVIRKIAMRISSSSDIRSIASTLNQAMRHALERDVLSAQVPAEMTYTVGVMEPSITQVSPVAERTEIAAAVADAVKHVHDQ